MVSGHVNLDRLMATEHVHIDRALTDKGLKHFVELAWHLVEPGRPFIPGWHIDAICDHLEACYRREIKRLVINVPPGSMKSLSCCVFFPAWLWTQDPSTKAIYASYNDKLSRRDSIRTRRIVESDWYQKRWGDTVQLHQDTRAAGKFTTTAGGFRLMTTVKGGVTGEHADIQVADDPIKPLDVSKSLAVAETALEECNSWWNETMASRLVDFQQSVRIIIMQRLVEGDLAGTAIANGYEHLMLPMEYEPKRQCKTSIGFSDPRTEEGELLNKKRFLRSAIETLKRELGSRGTAAQLQQNPIAAGGNIIKEEWARFYDVMPRRFTTLIQSWDCTFKDTDDSDFVVGQVWGAIGSRYFLVDQIRGRMSFVDTCNAIRSLTSKWPKARTKIIEDKANGPAVISALKREISGLIPVPPEGGKGARLHAVEPLWEAGNVYLPSPELATWVTGPDSFLDEVVGFPAKPHDDQVDAMSQALIYLESKSIGLLKAAMDNAAKKRPRRIA
jgi:predicted phage terminase large subunit-like protein